ncbi:MAG: hypothetical protein IJ685_06375, partial [Selenomonadaceae bacterium]|nr:hypothetical protein [Selenomonadaceae bacterium]
MKKFFRHALTTLIVFVTLLFAVIVGAAVQTFEGTGKYIMSEFETEEIAQKRAIQKATEDAQDKAGVYLTSFSKSVNANLVADE